MPQYMFLIHRPLDGPPPGVREPEMAAWGEYTQGLQDAGVLVHGAPVQGPEMATTVRVRDSETQIADGPVLDSRETLGGYYLVDCADLDTALKHAARVPNVHYGSIEVRPIAQLGAAAEAGREQAAA